MATQEELDAAKALKEKEDKEKEKEIEDKEKAEEKKIEEMSGDKEVIKSLLEAKRKANAEAKALRLKVEAFEKKQGEADDEKLKGEKKYEELFEKKDTELKEAKEKFKKQLIKMALKFETTAQGITDADLVSLIDSSDIKIGEDFSIDDESVKQTVKDFKEKKPDFFGEKEEGDETKPEGSKAPDLRNKVKGTQEGLTPDQRISKAYENTRQKK